MSAYVVEDRLINLLVTWASGSKSGDGGMRYFWAGKGMPIRTRLFVRLMSGEAV